MADDAIAIETGAQIRTVSFIRKAMAGRGEVKRMTTQSSSPRSSSTTAGDTDAERQEG